MLSRTPMTMNLIQSFTQPVQMSLGNSRKTKMDAALSALLASNMHRGRPTRSGRRNGHSARRLLRNVLRLISRPYGAQRPPGSLAERPIRALRHRQQPDRVGLQHRHGGARFCGRGLCRLQPGRHDRHAIFRRRHQPRRPPQAKIRQPYKWPRQA